MEMTFYNLMNLLTKLCESLIKIALKNRTNKGTSYISFSCFKMKKKMKKPIPPGMG
jgi:hypothetical protein